METINGKKQKGHVFREAPERGTSGQKLSWERARRIESKSDANQYRTRDIKNQF
jgi:hypothetical protein